MESSFKNIDDRSYNMQYILAEYPYLKKIRHILRTVTQNTGRGQTQEKSILIAEGGSFIAQVIRDHKTNRQWNYRYYPLGASITPCRDVKFRGLYYPLQKLTIKCKQINNILIS